MTPLGRLDSPTQPAGDSDWRGFRSRPQPTTLPPGIARYAANMRMERTTARPRAGLAALSTDIVLDNPPVVLDFDLPTEISVTSITRSGSTATVTTASSHGWSTGDVVAIYGATQTEYNGDFTIIVTGADTFTYTVSGSPATPATGTIVAAKGLRVYDTYADAIRTACVVVFDDLTEGIVRAGTNSAWLYREGVASVEIAYPAGESVETTDECALLSWLDKVFLFRGRSAGSELAISSITRSSSTVTVTTSASHGLSTNDWVRLIGQTDEAYRGVYQITVTGGTTFTYDIGAPTPTSPASVAGTCYKVKPPLQWDRNTANDFTVVTTGTAPSVGHIRMPPADWALAFNRQLLLPYDRDEHILSDFGDATVFDTLLAQLRIRPGEADWLVAAHPGPRTRYLVLYRKSLHVVQRNTADLAIDGVDEVSREVGCAARMSLATCGDWIVWLGDQGVQLARLTGDSFHLLTEKQPLSADVHDLIERINWTYAHRAVAAYFNNRYYLAVPLDTATVNNVVLVFNFLNGVQVAGSADSGRFGEWESVDRYPGDFDVVGLLVMDYQGRQTLHAVSSTGYLFALEQEEQDEYGSPGGALGSYDIEGSVLGRRHLFGTLEEKRVRAVRVDVDYPASGARAQVAVSTLNPDTSRTVADATATAAGDDTIRRRVRQRGVSMAIDLTIPAGRTILRAVELEAIVPRGSQRDQS